MKRIPTIAVATILVFAVLTNIAGPLFFAASAQVEESIASIRQHYAQINRSAAKYKKVKKDLSGFSAEGGQLVAYFDGQNIMKIAATFYGESGKAAEEYYYWNGKVIFVLRTDYRYNKPLSGKVVKTTIDRFYFSGDKLIRWIDENGKQVTSDAGEYQAKQKEYLDNSKQFTKDARSEKSTVESNQ
jgi:effector-binding domain-containing protein